MIVSEAVKQFIFHCQYEKNLSGKTLKAYQIDLQQFVIGLNISALLISQVEKDLLKGYIQGLFEKV